MARTLVSHVLDRTGAFGLLLKLRRQAPAPWLTVLTYHRIGDPATASHLDDGVVDARPEAFEKQLVFLKSYCTIIGIDELLAFRRGAALPPNPVLVTFDDGYKDNVDVALPILAKHDVRAVFFLATDYLTDRKLFWWDRIALHVKRSTREIAHVNYPIAVDVALGHSRADRVRAALRLMRPLKWHVGINIERYLEAVEEATGVTLGRDDERALADDVIMTWDHARLLQRAGMSVQSHTRSHRVLHTLDEREIDAELRGSKEEIEGRLGTKVDAVAYPVGRGLHCAPHARTLIRKAGYSLGFSNGTGISPLWRFDPYDVRRLCLEADVPDSYFHGIVALPYFAYEPHAHARA